VAPGTESLPASLSVALTIGPGDEAHGIFYFLTALSAGLTTNVA
jgi:hypothetical protein